jgi:hypothetical protein
MSIPLNEDGCPDLQLLVRLRGEQHACSLGESYDPARCPHHAGYPRITPEDWQAFDRAYADWQARRREILAEEDAKQQGEAA